MNKPDINKAIRSAEKGRKQKQQETVKRQVLETLRAVDAAEEERRLAVKKNQILKQDLKDLKAGKLGRIQERQDKDPLAKQFSKINVNEILGKTELHIQTRMFAETFGGGRDAGYITTNTANVAMANTAATGNTFTFNNAAFAGDIGGSDVVTCSVAPSFQLKGTELRTLNASISGTYNVNGKVKNVD